MSENINVEVNEVAEEETVVTEKKNFGSKLVNGVKKHWKVAASIAVTAGCRYAAYKLGVKVGIKSVDIKPVVDAVADTDITDVVEDAVQFTEV